MTKDYRIVQITNHADSYTVERRHWFKWAAIAWTKVLEDAVAIIRARTQ